MKARIKDWDDAVKSALADSENWYVEDDSIFGIKRECGDWGEVIEGCKDGIYFRNGNCVSYPLCVVDKVIEDDVDELIEDDDEPVNPDDILRYGKVIADDQIYTINVDVDRRPVTGDVRIRLVEFDGLLFYHKMVNGDVVDCRCVGKTDA